MGKRGGMKDSFNWEVDSRASGGELGLHLARALLISHEEAIDLIDFGSVQVNGRQERLASRPLNTGDRVQVHWPLHGIVRSYEIDTRRILFQDDTLLAYDKEPTVPSQQTPYDAYNNLFAALQRYLEKQGFSHTYVGLHHRLDRETSGVMVFTLDPGANRKLGRSFETRNVVKEYLAWVDGHPTMERWTCEDEIGKKQGRYATVPKGQGKPARTKFDILFRAEERTLIRAKPYTGRTHQIRLHLSAIGYPVVGDRLYGGSPSNRLYLHSHRLTLPHPISGAKLVLTAPVPPDWPEPRQVTIPGAPRH
jgi:23S rRNA pseudouridine1911/1915/1917 synthase